MATYRIVIQVDGQGNAQSFLGGVQSGLGGIAQIAAGGLLAGGIMRIGDALGGTVTAALDATKAYENLGISLEALFAREIKNASGTEKMIVVGQERVQLTQKEISEIAKLKQSLVDEGLARDTLAARIQEQKERIRQLTEQYGENGLVVIKERSELAQMENQMSKMDGTIAQHNSRISELNAQSGALVNVTQKVVEGQLSMQEALAQAGPKAKEYLDWVQQLAIKSPFKQSDVANAFKTVMAYGFASDAAKDLTQTLVDFSAVADPTGQKMGLIAYALGQIRTSDKLLTQDLRQLMNAGVDVNVMLGKMGYKLSDVGTAAIDSQEFLKVFSETMKSDFAGAAERSASTLTGLLSSLDDIKEVGLRDLFEGAFTALKPLLQEIVNTFSDPAFFERLRSIGTGIGEGVSTAINWLRQGIDWAQTFFGQFQLYQGVGFDALTSLHNTLRDLLPPELQPALRTVFSLIEQGIGFVQTTGIPALMSLGTWMRSDGIPALQQFGGWLQSSVVPALQQFGGFLQTSVLPSLIQFGQWIGGSVLPAVQQLASWIGTYLVPALAQMATTIGEAAGPALAQIGNWLTTTGIPALQAFGDILGPKIQASLDQLGPLLLTQVIPALTALGVWIFKTGLPALGELARVLGEAVNAALREMGPLWAGITNNFQKAVKFVSDTTTNLSAMATEIMKNIGPAVEWFSTNILTPMRDVFSSLVNLAESFLGWLKEIADMLSGMQLPDWLQRHSPSPLEQALMNTNAHLREMALLAPAAFRGWGNGWSGGSFGGMQLATASGYGGGTAYDNSRVTHFHAPIYVNANDARAFAQSLKDWEDGIVSDVRMGA